MGGFGPILASGSDAFESRQGTCSVGAAARRASCARPVAGLPRMALRAVSFPASILSTKSL